MSLLDAFCLESLRRIVDETFLVGIDFHRELPSTNDHALALAAEGQRATPWLVLAETQVSGRGRGANRWWSSRGALTFSLVLDGLQLRVPAARWPQISLTVGLAVCEAVERLVPGVPIGLKWPNDVYVDGRKLCGILVEVPSRAAGQIVIGVGVNVNNSFADAPSDIRSSATSLFDIAGYSLPLDAVLIAILACLEIHLDHLGDADDYLSERWGPYCILSGRSVRVEWGETAVEGTCRGIDPQGALIVDTAAGERRCLAGVVRQFG